MHTLSIVIPSKNRPVSLYRCLKSLFKENFCFYEVLLSNDSSKKYERVYNQIANKFQIKILKGPNSGIYSNHNFLYRKAKGSHIRIVDDDHTFPNFHFKICAKYIDLYPNDIISIGEIYPNTEGKIFFPGELNSRGFSSKPKNFESCSALASGSSIFPRKVFDLKIYEIDIYPFGMIWLEYGKRLKKMGFNIKILKDTHVIHHYMESNRSYNSKSLMLETTFFVMLANNLIYEKKIKNFFFMIYEVCKQITIYNFYENLLLFINAYKNFIRIKKKNEIWNFKN